MKFTTLTATAVLICVTIIINKVFFQNLNEVDDESTCWVVGRAIGRR